MDLVFRWLGQGIFTWLRGESAPKPAPESPALCSEEIPRPDVSAIRHAARERCLLHQVVTGRACRPDFSIERGAPTETSLERLLPRMEGEGDYSLPLQNSATREALSQLEGIRTYLSPGRSCRLDSRDDVYNLVQAYQLTMAAEHDENPQIRQAFSEGRLACVMQTLSVPGRRARWLDLFDRALVPPQDTGAHELLLTSDSRRVLRDRPEAEFISQCTLVRSRPAVNFQH